MEADVVDKLRSSRAERRASLRQALAANANDVAALVALGDLLLESSESDEAIAVLERARGLRPNIATRTLARAYAQRATRLAARVTGGVVKTVDRGAMADCHKALSLDPGEPSARALFARNLRCQADIALSRDDFAEAARCLLLAGDEAGAAGVELLIANRALAAAESSETWDAAVQLHQRLLKLVEESDSRISATEARDFGLRSLAAKGDEAQRAFAELALIPPDQIGAHQLIELRARMHALVRENDHLHAQVQQFPQLRVEFDSLADNNRRLHDSIDAAEKEKRRLQAVATAEQKGRADDLNSHRVERERLTKRIEDLEAVSEQNGARARVLERERRDNETWYLERATHEAAMQELRTELQTARRLVSSQAEESLRSREWLTGHLDLLQKTVRERDSEVRLLRAGVEVGNDGPLTEELISTAQVTPSERMSLTGPVGPSSVAARSGLTSGPPNPTSASRTAPPDPAKERLMEAIASLVETSDDRAAQVLALSVTLETLRDERKPKPETATAFLNRIGGGSDSAANEQASIARAPAWRIAIAAVVATTTVIFAGLWWWQATTIATDKLVASAAPPPVLGRPLSVVGVPAEDDDYLGFNAEAARQPSVAVARRDVPGEGVLATLPSFVGATANASKFTIQSEPSKPIAVKPEVARQEAARPEVTKPEVTKPEAGKPEVKPETGKSEVKPETGKQETVGPSPSTVAVNALLDEATKLVSGKPEAQQLARAAEKYRAVLKSAPTNTEAQRGMEHVAQLFSEKAITELDANNWQAAVAAYDSALDFDAERPEYFIGRGRAYLEASLVGAKIGDVNKAITDFSRAIELRPEIGEYRAQRAAAHRAAFATSNSEPALISAIADLTAALVQQPAEALFYLARANCYLDAVDIGSSLGDYPRAVADLDRAVELSPRDDRLRYDRATAVASWATASDDPRRLLTAIADLNEAISIRPNEGHYYFARANAIYWASENGVAERADGDVLADYSKAITLNPKELDALVGRAQFLQAVATKTASKEGLLSAVQDYTSAIELAPQQGALYAWRSRTLAALGQNDRATADRQRALELGYHD